MNPLVSIIIPTFNRATLIIETLNSVKNQSYSNWECIIVDDGSSDDTASVICNYTDEDRRYLYVVKDKNRTKGPSACRNIGISLAKGKYVVFLDSDDVFDEFCLENRIKCVAENGAFDFYIFKSQLFYDRIENLGDVFNIPFERYDDDIYLKSFIKDDYPFCIMSVLWVTDALKSIGGFDENLVVLEDPDLHIKAFIKGLKSYTKADSLPDSFYRKNSISTLLTKESRIRHIKAKFFYYKKYLPLFKKEMKNRPLTFFRVHVLNDGNFFDASQYYFLFLQNKILSINQVFLIFILLVYKFLCLDKVRGLGFYRLSLILK